MEVGSLKVAQAAQEIQRSAGISSPAAPGVDFGKELGNAIGQLEGLQQTADTESLKLAHGAGNLHETALALEQADLGMRVATRVRNKLVEAYQEVMRMTV